MAQRRRIDDAPGQEADRTISGVTGRTPAAVAGDESHGAVAGAEVGVGPWPGGPDTWPDDPRLDPDLLAHGDRRNVLDHYRYWTVAAIVADLDTRRLPLHIAVENLAHDLNIGSIVRTANAFNLAGVHVVGRRRWNRRGAMVTDRYLSVHHHPDVPAFAAAARAAGREVVGVDLVPGSVPVEAATMPRDAVLVFGQESTGLSEAMRAECSRIVHVTQYGSTRSMNVAAAAAIVMHRWVTAWGPGPAGP